MAAIRDVSDKVRAAAALRESEEWLRTVFETTPECVKLLDREGRILEINQTGVAMLGGQDAASLKGRRHFELLSAENRAAYEEFIAAVFRGELRRLSYELSAPDGSRRFHSAYAAPMWETAEHRQVKAMLVVTRDVTSQREVQRTAQALMRGTAAVVGEAFLHSLVRELSETLGTQRVFVAVKDAERPGWLRTLAHFERGRLTDNFTYDARGGPCGRVVEEDAPLYLPDHACAQYPAGVCGGNTVGGYYGAPLHDAARRAIGLLVVASEQSLRLEPIVQSLLTTFALRAEAEIVRLQADEERRKMEAQLFQGQKMEALGNLAGGVAHDFNNLLTGIINFATLARDEVPADSPVRSHLGQVLNGSNRAKELVRQILAFSRREPAKRVPLRLATVVSEAEELLRSMMPAEVRFEVQLEPALPPVLADVTQMHQVLMNLVVNAAQAMKGRGGLLQVRLSEVALGAAAARRLALPAARHVLLEVSDQGMGIDPAMLPRIFEPFFSTKGQGEGSGLGLAVVHGIVKNHEGAIDVASDLGRGTVFSVYLPVWAGEAAKGGEPSAAHPLVGARVLVVDDEQNIRDSIKTILERCGALVTVSPSGEDALAKFWAAEAPFDLVLADLQMPGLSGVELAGRIHAQRPEVRIAILSGYLGEWTEDRLRDYGVRCVLTKPLTPEALVGAVAGMLRRAG